MSDPPTESVELEAVGVLSDLDSDERRQLARFGHATRIEPREDVIREGDCQDCFYIILSGKLRVYRLKDGFESRLAELGVGESLGEMGFLDYQSASANVQAAGGATIWRMSREEFDRFVESHPQAATKLLRALATTVTHRLRRAVRKLSEQGQAVGEGWW